MKRPSRTLLGLFVGSALIVLGAAANAFEIDYDPRRPAELRPCDEHLYRGRFEESQGCYTRLLASSPDLLTRAESAWRTNDLRRANDLFRELLRAKPEAVHE